MCILFAGRSPPLSIRAINPKIHRKCPCNSSSQFLFFNIVWSKQDIQKNWAGPSIINLLRRKRSREKLANQRSHRTATWREKDTERPKPPRIFLFSRKQRVRKCSEGSTKYIQKGGQVYRYSQAVQTAVSARCLFSLQSDPLPGTLYGVLQIAADVKWVVDRDHANFSKRFSLNTFRSLNKQYCILYVKLYTEELLKRIWWDCHHRSNQKVQIILPISERSPENFQAPDWSGRRGTKVWESISGSSHRNLRLITLAIQKSW